MPEPPFRRGIKHMSLLSLLRKVLWARAPEDNPDVSETQVLLASLDLRLKDCERISWRNDKRITRAFGPIPIDEGVDKKVGLSPQPERGENQPADQPVLSQPGEGEPTLTPEQIAEMFRR